MSRKRAFLSVLDWPAFISTSSHGLLDFATAFRSVGLFLLLYCSIFPDTVCRSSAPQGVLFYTVILPVPARAPAQALITRRVAPFFFGSAFALYVSLNFLRPPYSSYPYSCSLFPLTPDSPLLVPRPPFPGPEMFFGFS